MFTKSVCGLQDSRLRQSLHRHIVVEGNMATSFGPFVMLLGQDLSCQAICRRTVGEDSHRVGTTASFLVKPLPLVVGPQLLPVCRGEAGESRDAGAASSSSIAARGESSRSCFTTRSTWRGVSPGDQRQLDLPPDNGSRRQAPVSPAELLAVADLAVFEVFLGVVSGGD